MSRMNSDFLEAQCMRGYEVCEGILESDQEDCSCHINAPCWHCESMTLRCPECGWNESEDLEK
jgi:hypothetical protein